VIGGAWGFIKVSPAAIISLDVVGHLRNGLTDSNLAKKRGGVINVYE
jgi:hypothetical protein